MTGNDIRRLALKAVHAAGKGHIGGVLSCADILAVMYSGVIRPQDRFIMSKGHCAVGLYAALELAGILPAGETMTINQGARLGEHPHRGIPGVIVNGGSLGHGLSLACGFALADKLSGSDARTYVLLGDGDCMEGQTWEAAAFGAHHYLNITALVDMNGLITGGSTFSIMSHRSLWTKWLNFGWGAWEVDGHDQQAIRPMQGVGPLAVIARTVKGKGVSFMEGDHKWHHGTMNTEQFAWAMEELRGHA